MKFGFILPHYPFELILETAVLAENSGFDSVWMTDHMVGIGIRKWRSLEAWSVLSRLSAETKRVTLGTCASDPHRRRPSLLAQTTTTLDIISGGRAALCLGAGEAMNLDPYGIDWNKPASRLREAIMIIKRLWTEDNVNHTGEFFKLKEAFLSPRPLQKPHPPLWVAANSPNTMKTTAELSDGWIPTGVLMTPQIFRENLGKVQAWAKDTGRDPQQIEPAIFLFTLAAQDRESARKFLELPAKLVLCLTPKLLKDYGVELPSKDLHWSRFVFNPKTVQNLVEGIKGIPDKAVEDIFVFGTPDDCISKLEKYEKAGARHFLICLLAPPVSLKSSIQLYARNVLSYFK